MGKPEVSVTTALSTEPFLLINRFIAVKPSILDANATLGYGGLGSPRLDAGTGFRITSALLDVSTSRRFTGLLIDEHDVVNKTIIKNNKNLDFIVFP